MTRQLAYIGVAACIALAVASLAVAQGRGGGRAGGAAEANVATPRTPDGHPDLSGMWGGGGGGGGGDKPDEKGNLTVLFKQRPCSQQQKDLGNCEQAVNFERDSGVEQRMDPIPMYK